MNLKTESGYVYTEDDIIEMIEGNPNGFDLARILTGISRIDLEELLSRRGYEPCAECEDWVHESEGVYGFPVGQYLCAVCREEEV